MSAKKRGPGRPPKSAAKPAPSHASHAVPSGFWAQTGAVFLILFAVVLLVGMFGAGGTLPRYLAEFVEYLIGWTAWILPFVFVWQAVQIFRSDENRLPVVIWLATILFTIFWSGLFQLLLPDPAKHAMNGGGIVGWGADRLLLSVLNVPIAALVLVVLILILSLFVLSISPKALFQSIATFFRSEAAEDDQNAAVAKTLAEKSAEKPKSPGVIARMVGKKSAENPEIAPEKPPKIKLNKGVETVEHSDDDAKSAPEKSRETPSALTMTSDPNWEFPGIDLLEKKKKPADAGDVQKNAEIIHDTLAEFNINVEMEGANIGPKVTQYTLKPSSGVKLSRITDKESNLALNLGAKSLRIEAPIPGKRAVGIEIPNLRAADVRLYGILQSEQWRKAREPLSFAVGLDIYGDAVIGELNKMPHLLIAGTTGSGKSVMINSLLCSLLYRNTPADMKLILVDPKQVEMAPYEDIPHLLTPVIFEPEKTISALKWAVQEMENRYTKLSEEKLRDIKSYNNKMRARGEPTMPYIVIVVDEMADLMMLAKRDVEALIVRLAQKARAIGIHLVLATQRPDKDVVTGLIKANIPASLAFTVKDEVNSRIILGQSGAEKLLGAGDMLMMTASLNKPKRIQGAFVSDEEVIKITDFLRMAAKADYNPDIISQQVAINQKGGVMIDVGDDDDDFMTAVRAVVAARKASTSLLQRRMKIGYSKAARIMDEMEERGIIGPADGSRPREVLISSADDIPD